MKRRETVFRLVFEKTIGRRVLRTFAQSLGEWEIIAEGRLDILASIPYDSIIDTVFGTALICVLLRFLNVIGYVGSTDSSIWSGCSTRGTLFETICGGGGGGGEATEWDRVMMSSQPTPSMQTLQSNNQSQSVISFRTISKSMLWLASQLSNFKVSDLFLT